MTVTFTCHDPLSGVASCPEPVTASDEVSGQAITRMVHDKAGNAATMSATINLDRTTPQVAAMRTGGTSGRGRVLTSARYSRGQEAGMRSGV